MHMKALRFYTHGQSDIQVAFERQIALVHLCHAVMEASITQPDIWEHPTELVHVCRNSLMASGFSEEGLGLRVSVYMRAQQWLGSRCTIISPVLPITEALAVHAQLLRARKESWEAFRAEWVRLMRHKRGISSVHAETIADKGRRSVVGRSLTQAVRGVEQALRREDLRAQQIQRARAREQRSASRAAIMAAAQERRALNIRQQLWSKRRQWFRQKGGCSNLTMEDIMHWPQSSNEQPALPTFQLYCHECTFTKCWRLICTVHPTPTCAGLQFVASLGKAGKDQHTSMCNNSAKTHQKQVRQIK